MVGTAGDVCGRETAGPEMLAERLRTNEGWIRRCLQEGLLGEFQSRDETAGPEMIGVQPGGGDLAS